MTVINNEDWLHVLENTDYEPAEHADTTYQSYRFVDLDLETVTISNFTKTKWWDYGCGNNDLR